MTWVATAWLLRTNDRKPADSIARVLDQHECAGLKFCRSLGHDGREALIHRVGSLIGHSQDDHAWFVEDSKGEHVAKIEIESDDNAGVGAGALNDLTI